MKDSELGRGHPATSGYVGIDVHRKRSQVAVVTEDGQVHLNKNVVNGSEPSLQLIGDLPSSTPVAFEAASTRCGHEEGTTIRSDERCSYRNGPWFSPADLATALARPRAAASGFR